MLDQRYCLPATVRQVQLHQEIVTVDKEVGMICQVCGNFFCVGVVLLF